MSVEGDKSDTTRDTIGTIDALMRDTIEALMNEVTRMTASAAVERNRADKLERRMRALVDYWRGRSDAFMGAPASPRVTAMIAAINDAVRDRPVGTVAAAATDNCIRDLLNALACSCDGTHGTNHTGETDVAKHS